MTTPREIVFRYWPLLGWRSGLTKAANLRSRFARDAGPFEVTFKLTGGNFEFDQADPIWVSDDVSECPSQNIGHADIKNPSASGRQLTLTNENYSQVDLRYQLNVIDRRTGSRMPIDPIMENGGRT